MKISKILLVFLLLFSIVSFAQGGKFREKREQIKALKVAFITEELKLTPAEAEKFWPLYNAYDSKQTELRQQKLKSFSDRMESGSVDKMSDKEATNFLIQMENTEDEIFESKKKFGKDLKNVLAPIKIIKLKKAEEDFSRKLLRQYRNKTKS